MHANEESKFTVERLRIVITPNRRKLGEYSAANVIQIIKNILQDKDEIRMIFAAAPSQDEFLQELVKDKSIDWSKIIAFHMDEYIGLPEKAEQLFSEYLTRHLFPKVDFKKVHLINSHTDDIDKECERYESLLKEKPIDIVCMGIGENGHIAFNDPPVADFSDEKFVKIVMLDESCRKQQVNDGCFLRLPDVPKRAITITIPALLNGKYLNVVVPGIRKANAIKDVLSGDISTECPASILRKHKNANLYLDLDSASKYIKSA